MKEFPKPSEEVLASIRNCTTAVVCGHGGPDGDCVNSVAAMGLLLKALGKKYYLINDGPFFRTEVRFIQDLITEELPEEILNKNTLGIVVDCSTPSRLGSKSSIFDNLTVTVIDHHSSGEQFGDHRYVVPESISTTLLVYQVYKALGVEITKEAAQYLFRGFATDSGYFKFLHENSGETLRIVADLADCGVVPNDEYHYINGGKPFENLQFLGKIINRIERLYDNRVIISHEEREDFKLYGDNSRASDEFYGQAATVEKVQVIFFFKISKREENSIEVGIRSTHSCSFDAGAFAALFGGGGHEKAAGLTISGTYEEVKEKILKAVEKYLD
ncbi:MAG: bifunctional oligoribonuclease/PAP phosphatase NrnA [Sphaerochaetaceae bacterium]|nr:bifunctional oligoribonuclease/PAP phosphatase NrnA [Sphaerochaetaceae bacterium]